MSGFRKSERELGPTQHLTHALSFESLHNMRHTASLAPTSPQLSKVSISPRPHTTVVCEREGLGITAAAGHVYRMMSCQGSNLLGSELCLVVPMPQPAILAQSPREELSRGQNSRAMGTTARDFLYRPAFQGLD